MDRRRVLIVGGGIAGLALARMLARAGVSLELIEREPAWRPSGTGMYLPGNAARALRALGLEAQVASRAVEIPRQRFHDQRGRRLFEVDVAELWRPVGQCLAVHRAELHELLVEAAGEVPIRIGAGRQAPRSGRRRGLRRVQRRNERHLRSRGRGGRDPQRGAPAGVRPDGCDRHVGQIGWRFVAPRPREVTTWSVMLGRGTAFLTLPLAGDRVYCYCDIVSRPGPETPERVGPERLGELFSEFADPAATLLEELDAAAAIRVSTIEEVALDSWAREHVVLIGDAAHATAPNMAQGAAMALEDAFVLTDSLQASRRSPTPSRRSRPGAGLEPTGSAPRPTAATAPDTSHRP
jgi:FAD-dependent urate hydroxylase